MTLEARIEPTGGNGAVDHLEHALDSDDPELKNYYIRQALQLLIVESESHSAVDTHDR